MKTLFLTLIALLASNAARAADSTSCGSSPIGGKFDTSCSFGAADPALDFKGTELYSWQEKGRWFFSLVPGKNTGQQKTELLQAKISGLPALRKRLSAMKPGETLTWSQNSVQDLTLKKPPQAMIREIEQVCAKRQIKLVHQ